MFSSDYLSEVAEVAARVDRAQFERLVAELSALRGRLYVLGIGGSAANAVHMAADFRKLCNIDAEAFDNVAEITARANDEGFDTIFTGWLSRLTEDDALFVLSVGGGTETVSVALVRAIDLAKEVGAKVYGIVGPNGGHTARRGDLVICVPMVNAQRVTPHTEAFQAVLWHGLVSHPQLKKGQTKW